MKYIITRLRKDTCDREYLTNNFDVVNKVTKQCVFDLLGDAFKVAGIVNDSIIKLDTDVDLFKVISTENEII